MMYKVATLMNCKTGLSNMQPVPVLNYACHSAYAYAVLLSQVFVVNPVFRAITLSHFRYLLGCQWGKVSAVIGAKSPFALAIFHVVCVRAKLEMVWSHTWWIVTAMHYLALFWGRTNVYFIGRSMGQCLYVCPKGSISTLIPMASPYPTGAKFGTMLRSWAIFIDLSPETLKDRSSFFVWMFDTSKMVATDKVSRLTFKQVVLDIIRGRDLRRLTTAALTKAERYGRLFLHGVTPIQLFCATLRGVTSTAGASWCPDYSTKVLNC